MVIKSINPKTGKVIQIFNETTKNEIENLILNSRLAQKKWQNKSKEERIITILELKNSFLKYEQEIIETINEECGFDIEDNRAAFYDILDGIDYYVEQYEKQENINFKLNEAIFTNSNAKIKYYPLGVIAQIGIWNYPFWQTLISSIPALLVGNSIIFKPSEYSTKTGVLISKIINETKNFPKDLFILIIGKKKEGKYLIKHEKINAIVYTGNEKTGIEIIKNSGIKPLILELSGNDGAIICNDCDLEQTISGVTTGAFSHSGEICIRIKRIYVVKKIAKEFISKLIEKTSKLKLGVEITPIISKKALLKIKFQVDIAKKENKILFGGNISKENGFYFEPTIIEIENNSSYSMQNEIFGPVISIMLVKDEKEAIKHLNDSKYGLGATIWTQDYEKAKFISEQLEVGNVWINDSNLPLVGGEYFKGWKNSGISNSNNRLQLFQKTKTIISHKSKEKRSWWF